MIHPQYEPAAKAKAMGDRGDARSRGSSRPVRMLAANRGPSLKPKSVCTESSATRSARKDSPRTPLGKANLPQGWTPPQAPDDTLDPRAVGSPALVADMIKACGTVGRRQGPRFQTFYG
jgi:hypothetical protein